MATNLELIDQLDLTRKPERRPYESPAVHPLNWTRWRRLTAIRAGMDLLALTVALAAATATPFGRKAIQVQGGYGRGLWMWALLLWGSLALVGAYERHRTDSFVEEFRSVVRGVALGEAFAIAGSFFVDFELSRYWALFTGVGGVAAVLMGRGAIRVALGAFRRRGRLRRRAVVVGADESGRGLARALENAVWGGVDIVGLVSLQGEKGEGVLGSVENLRQIVTTHHATEVVLSPSAVALRFSSIVSALDGLPIELRLAPGVEGFLHSRLAVHPLGDRPLISVERVELRPGQRIAKRAIDLLLGIPLLLLAAPIIVLCAAAIRMDSKGPAFFGQQRVGARGREFRVWKLRSMVVDAEKRRAEIMERNEAEGLLFKMRHDPRITRVGAFLRKTSLDELPQLFNVIKGDMSLVGPRPPLPEEVASYEGSLQRRLLVKPGITGLWQVSGRHELSFEDYVRHDLLYVQSWSVALDLLILLRTIPAVVFRKGAY